MGFDPKLTRETEQLLHDAGKNVAILSLRLDVGNGLPGAIRATMNAVSSLEEGYANTPGIPRPGL